MKQKVLALFLTAILTIWALPVAGAEEELISMDFENGYEGVTLGAWHVEHSITDQYAANGQKSLENTVTGDWASLEFPIAKIENTNYRGKRYEAEFWLKYPQGTSLSAATSYWDEELGNTATNIFAHLNGEGEFKKYTVQFTIPASGPVWDVRLTFLADTLQVGEKFYIDDLTVREVPDFVLLPGQCQPAAEDAAAMPTDEIRLAFSVPIKQAEPSNFTINGSSQPIRQVILDGAYATLVLESALEENTEYTVGVSGITDYIDRQLEFVSYSFRTLNLSAPPYVARCTPEDNAANVDTDTEITIEFNTSIHSLDGCVTINGTEDLIESIETEDNRIFHIRLKELENATLYAICVENAQSIYGVPMQEAYSSCFYTKQKGTVVWENDFETGSMENIGGWETTRSISDEYAASGTYSMKVESEKANRTAEITANMDAGVLYKLSFSAALDRSNQTNQRVSAAIAYWDGDLGQLVQKLVGSTEVLGQDGSFSKTEIYFAIPAGTAVGDTRFYFYGDDTPGGGTFYLDDIVLEKMPDLEMLPISTPVQGGMMEVTDEINLIFSEAINVPESIMLNGAPVRDAIVESSTLIVQPTEDLENNKSYTLVLKGIRDIYGRSMEDLVISFQTVPSYNIEGFTLLQDKESGAVTARAERIENHKVSDGFAQLKLILLKDGFMIEQKSLTMQIPSGEYVQGLEVSIDALPTGCQAIAVIWENSENVMPLCKSITIWG